MARKKWGPGNPLWEWQQKKTGKKTGGNMARRRYAGFKRGRRRGGGLFGSSLVKAALFGIGGGVLGRMVNVNPLLSAVAGGFMAAGLKGALIGAGAEMVGGNMVSGLTTGITGAVGVKKVLYG